MHEEKLRSPLLAQHRAEELRGGFMPVLFPCKTKWFLSQGAALSSALCDSNRAQGNSMELCQGTSMQGFKESLDIALRHGV